MSTSTRHSRAISLSILALAAILGVIHAFIGTVALTPVVSADYHRELKLTFNAFAKSLTFLHSYIDKGKLGLLLRYILSVCQISTGIILAANNVLPPFIAILGNYGLLIVNLIFLVLQFNVGATIDRIAPTLVFCVLLVARLVLIEQSSKKVKPVKAKQSKSIKASTPKKNKAE